MIKEEEVYILQVFFNINYFLKEAVSLFQNEWWTATALETLSGLPFNIYTDPVPFVHLICYTKKRGEKIFSRCNRANFRARNRKKNPLSTASKYCKSHVLQGVLQWYDYYRSKNNKRTAPFNLHSVTLTVKHHKAKCKSAGHWPNQH